MASPLDMSYGQMLEFERTLIAAGLDGDDILEILRSPKKAKTWVAELKASRTPPLFVSPEQQLQNVRMWWGSFFYDNQYRYVEEQIARLTPTTEPLVAWVLTPHFNSVEQTFDWLWKQTAKTHGKHWRWPELKSDPEHLKLLDDIEFTTNRLTWELIDFGAHLNHTPRRALSSDSAEFALLAAACHHRQWARSMGSIVNDTLVPHVNLSGLQVMPPLPQNTDWWQTPTLCWRESRLELSALSAYDCEPNWACPVRIQRVE